MLQRFHLKWADGCISIRSDPLQCLSQNSSDAPRPVISIWYYVQGASMNEKTSGSVMVVGAGIAGMQSALDLAESGYYVYLVEKEPAIGGLMSQLDKTFPTNDCAM